MSDSAPVTTFDREVLITRIFDVPREQVFKAWTDPDEVDNHGARTRMTLSDGPYPPGGRGHAEAGYQAALDTLAKHLEPGWHRRGPAGGSGPRLLLSARSVSEAVVANDRV